MRSKHTRNIQTTTAQRKCSLVSFLHVLMLIVAARSICLFAFKESCVYMTSNIFKEEMSLNWKISYNSMKTESNRKQVLQACPLLRVRLSHRKKDSPLHPSFVCHTDLLHKHDPAHVRSSFIHCTEKSVKEKQHAVSGVPQQDRASGRCHSYMCFINKHKHFILYLLGFYVKMLNKLNSERVTNVRKQREGGGASGGQVWPHCVWMT